ncbi:MAG: sugar phosphate isomerase/epimerase family protein [Planctomycetota bacterium]|jgi:hexulose-6-phosphate isomerase
MMKNSLSRREFLATSVAAATGTVLGLSCDSSVKEAAGSTFGKAVIVKEPTEEALTKVKAAGFDGVEAGIISRAEAAQARTVAERLGLRIHSVLRGWARFNSKDTDEVESSLAVTIDALGTAEGYGADAVLLVPARIDAQPMPEPWEFQVEFDRKTGHLVSVAEDTDRYRDYIAAHNHAWDTCRTAINKLIPAAEDSGVVIAVENVWNNLFVDPHHFAHFIDSFQSPWVRAYFDIGNHVKYSAPQDWIAVLGKRITKCHVKDFKLNPDGRGGRFVNIREGSVNWPIVIKSLKDSGYRGWMTIEGSDKLSLDERSRRLDLIISGK